MNTWGYVVKNSLAKNLEVLDEDLESAIATLKICFQC